MLNIEPLESKTDEELVTLTLKNQDHFLYLVQRYEKKLLNYILRISNVNFQEAEDILQESFIKIYTNLNDFDKKLKFSSWAYRITHNQVISNYRKHKARPLNINLNGNENLKNLISELDVEKKIDLQYLNKNIYQILNRLEIKYREVLILKFFEEKSYQEISDIIKRPLGTVATLINRAKKQFKRELVKQDNNF